MGALSRFSVVLGDFEHVNRRGQKIKKNGAEAFEAAGDRGKSYFRALHNYLLHYARDAYEEFEGEPVLGLDAVDVLTVHQAKGLEWPVVFLPSLVQGRFPSRRAGQAQECLLPESVFPASVRSRYEGGDAEERRLFYVALTRARDSIYLSSFERRTNRFQPSEYLTEITGRTPPRLDTLPLPPEPETGLASEPPAVDVTFSDLATFGECGYRYRLSSVFAFQTQLAPELGYGRAIHHVLRQVAERVRCFGYIPADAELDNLVAKEFYVPFASPQAWETMRKAARKLVAAYVERYPSDLCRVWAVERPFALNLQGGAVSGRADIILDEEGGRHGTLAIVDYKVATDEAREERYREQLRVYSIAGRGEGLDVQAAFLHDLKRGTRSSVDIGDTESRQTLVRIGELFEILGRAEFIAKPDKTRCQACEYNLICTHAPRESLGEVAV
jgi:DNA helicase-2/ATP-dependent DNA helicase PcrA